MDAAKNLPIWEGRARASDLLIGAASPLFRLSQPISPSLPANFYVFPNQFFASPSQFFVFPSQFLRLSQLIFRLSQPLFLLSQLLFPSLPTASPLLPTAFSASLARLFAPPDSFLVSYKCEFSPLRAEKSPALGDF